MKTQSAIKVLTEAKKILEEMKAETNVDDRIAALGVAVNVMEESIRGLKGAPKGPHTGEIGGER